jgi:hypothetical protein
MLYTRCCNIGWGNFNYRGFWILQYVCTSLLRRFQKSVTIVLMQALGAVKIQALNDFFWRRHLRLRIWLNHSSDHTTTLSRWIAGPIRIQVLFLYHHYDPSLWCRQSGLLFYRGLRLRHQTFPPHLIHILYSYRILGILLEFRRGIRFGTHFVPI